MKAHGAKEGRALMQRAYDNRQACEVAEECVRRWEAEGKLRRTARVLPYICGYRMAHTVEGCPRRKRILTEYSNGQHPDQLPS